ncbi:MAG: CPBP family intramembrane metalloprotease [Chlamydiales bacterium]|nr:CPBP family intramembrane metalloprotease [Chlamydiia bacterium]MCP5508231.1 CPBP family intramembrane metalloprotease [Chlamydiales bacterium]
METFLWENLSNTLVAGLLFAASSGIAWYAGFYRWRFPIQKEGEVSLIDLIFGIGIFLLAAIVIAPGIAGIFIYLLTGSIEVGKPDVSSWINIFAIYFSSGCVLLYAASLRREKTLAIWGQETRERHIKSFVFGAGAWLVGYFAMLFVGQGVATIVTFVTGEELVDQVAVKQVKDLLGRPLLFTATVAAVITVVPIVEEILFRGLLQSWLRQKLGRVSSIVLASLIFSLFHFSSSQEYSNIPLLASLFTLSLYLGFVYEKRNSLWAPIGLHMTFNTISIMMITQTTTV